MSDDKYDAVISAIPKWQPSKEQKVFGITAIKSIVTCTLPEAIEIRNRLVYEGAMPKRTWQNT